VSQASARPASLLAAKLLAALLLASVPAEAGDHHREVAELRDEAAALYKQRQYTQAREALERALRLAPEEHELLRQIGACRAMQGDREGAYEAYREYTRQCPGCMYAPQVRSIIRDYEAASDLPLTPLPPEEQARQDQLQAELEARRAEREEAMTPELTSRDELMARRLLANARTIRKRNPLGALANCLEALRRLPRGHALHAEARELYQEIAWMPAPPLEAPARGGYTEEGIREAKRRYEEAYVLKGTNPELAKRKLEEAISLTPEGDIYHWKAVKLLERLESGEE